jgi:hypothetical protein
MRQAFTLPPISGLALIRKVFAGCCQPPLRKGPSQRYLCRPSLRARTPTPAASQGAISRFFPWDVGLPRVNTGRRLASPHHCYFGWANDFGAAVIPFYSFMFMPTGLFASQVAPTLTLRVSGSRDFYGRAYHGWLPAPCSGYANHPNRAIDGEGTRTPQIRQTCWLLRSLAFVLPADT